METSKNTVNNSPREDSLENEEKQSESPRDKQAQHKKSESLVYTSASLGKQLREMAIQVGKLSSIDMPIGKSEQMLPILYGSQNLGKQLREMAIQVGKLSSRDMPIVKSEQMLPMLHGSQNLGKQLREMAIQVGKLSSKDMPIVKFEQMLLMLQGSQNLGKQLREIAIQLGKLSSVNVPKIKTEQILPLLNYSHNLGKHFRELSKSMNLFSRLSQQDLNNAINRLIQQEAKIPENLLENVKEISLMDFIESIEKNKIEDSFEENIDSNYIDIGNENELNVYEWINEMCRKIINFPTYLKQNHPALYISYYMILVLFIWNLIMVPYLQDKLKSEVFLTTLSEENTPSKNASYIKSNMDFDSEVDKSMINRVRVTNRETIVYKSSKRKNGTIDTIPPNKPVIIMKKNRNWSLVLYTSSEAVERYGWVFTRNLSR